jgi:hypothetical protein
MMPPSPGSTTGIGPEGWPGGRLAITAALEPAAANIAAGKTSSAGGGGPKCSVMPTSPSTSGLMSESLGLP